MGQDSGSAQSTTTAGISGIAGDQSVRTGDATGIERIFDQNRVQREIDVQVAITAEFGKQASKAAGTYADQQAIAARRTGNEAEAKKWDEGGEYRSALHTGIGALTGGLGGAVGAALSASALPSIGESIAALNLPDGVRDALNAAIGTALGSVGGASGAAAGLNQAGNNYISHSPFRQVRQTVSQENARLLNACGANCTPADFLNIDQQVAQVERAANLAAIGQVSSMTQQQVQELAQLMLELAPLYGTGESALQLITGHSSLTGEEVSRLWAAIGVVPVAGGVLKKVGEPVAEAISQSLKKIANETKHGPNLGANSAPTTVELTFDKATRTWTTPAGIDYGPGSVDGNRVKHVLEHAEPDPKKTMHTVFNVERKEILRLVDDAWFAKGNPLPNDPGAYVVPMGRVIGTAGETSIKIIVRPGTNKIITAYPIQ